MNILVIDGQGGRIGKAIIEALRAKGADCEITAVGTNTIATGAMLKAGADRSATGENPVVVMCGEADVITGPVGIIAANSLVGEITPKMALAVSESRAHKVLIPVNKCRVSIAGVRDMTLGEYISDAVGQILALK